MLEHWLTCPFCPDEFEEVRLGGDDEHIEVWCTNCLSYLKAYNTSGQALELMEGNDA